MFTTKGIAYSFLFIIVCTWIGITTNTIPIQGYTVGTALGLTVCDGGGECQFKELGEAAEFCFAHEDCTAIVLHPGASCAGNKGCYTPRNPQKGTALNLGTEKSITFTCLGEGT